MPHPDPFGPAVRSTLARDTGRAVAPFVDHHVHLQMIDPGGLAPGGLGGVVDLGANPAAINRLAAGLGVPHVRLAGAFLTARGGYPSDRAWAPEGSVRELADADATEGTAALPGAIEAAVAEQVSFGASTIKVMLNANAGPVLSRATLDAIIAVAHDSGLPVVAHAEGAGMVALAIEAGVDALAHTPWTERLPDDAIARAAGTQAWNSTLDIHSRGDETPAFEIALDNLARFHAAGGRVLYGTDLGNGALPLGVNPRELAGLVRAGLDAASVLAALTDPWPAPAASEGPSRPESADAGREAPVTDPLSGIRTFVPGEPPREPRALPAWLAHARVVPTEDLEEIP